MTITKQSGGLPERHKAHISWPPRIAVPAMTADGPKYTENSHISILDL